MPHQDLINYIKQNLISGFAEAEIREALLGAGWQEAEIKDSMLVVRKALPSWAFSQEQASLEETPAAPSRTAVFLARHRKLLLTLLLLIAAVPLLTWGGMEIYQLLSSRPGESVQGLLEVAAEDAATTRDLLRLRHIQELQTALDNYFLVYKSYPRSLNELVELAILKRLPTDPKTLEPYLYSAFGNPVLYYSLSFILETKVGSLKPGLMVVTSDKLLPASEVKGPASPPGRRSDLLKITDLTREPFYPQEEVTLTIKVDPPLKFQKARLLVGSTLDLLDERPPLEFSFFAPKSPGTYPVKVFAFDESGTSYFQETSLTVQQPSSSKTWP